MKPRQFLRCRSFWFRCFRGPPLPWGHTSWHRFYTRARSHPHTHFFLPCSSCFLSACVYFCYLFYFFFIFCMNSISQIGFHFEKCSCYLFFFFFGWFASHTSKIICFFAKMSFSLHRFGFALPFYFIKQTARCTKFGLVRATTTHF